MMPNSAILGRVLPSYPLHCRYICSCYSLLFSLLSRFRHDLRHLENLTLSATPEYLYLDGKKIHLRTRHEIVRHTQSYGTYTTVRPPQLALSYATYAIVRHCHTQLIEFVENIAHLTLFCENVFSRPTYITISYIPLS